MNDKPISPELDGYLTHGKKLPVLDGLRGYAITLVLLFHCAWSGPQLQGVNTSFLESFGWTGVDLFFVLSGFLITTILLQTKNDPRYFQKFYARRILRIFPLYFAYLLFMFCYYRDPAGFWYHVTYTSNFYMIFHNPAPEHSPAWLTWSLSVEEQFYLIWPLLILLLNRKAAIIVNVLFIVIAPCLRFYLHVQETAPIVSYVFLLTRMDTLSCGALIALLLNSDTGYLQVLKKSAWIVMVLAVAGIYWVWAQRGTYFFAFTPHTSTAGFSFTALLYAAVLVLAISTRSKLIDVLLKNKLILLVGKHSYCMYLIHCEVVYFMKHVFINSPLLQALPAGYAHVVFYSYVIAVFAATLLLSILIWHVFEKHFINFKKAFAYSL